MRERDVMADVLDRLKTALSDRYTIERELGSGGMATVFLAEDRKHRRQVALKLLKPELGAVLGGDRFLREIEIAARLNHPHILPLHESGDVEGLLYYVMPFVEGESLRDKLTRQTQLSVDDAIETARQVASALDYAHRQGVVHRDIKPENILLQEGQAVVADFGIARALREAGGERLTETGLSLGTPHYMSPEQASATQQLDGRTDVYALGCMLYEMLAGDPPFTGPTSAAVIARQLVDPVPSLRTVRPTVSAELERVIAKALAKVPADRFETAGAFIEAAGAAAQIPVVPTRERRALGGGGSGQRSRRVLWAAGSSALVALVAAAVWLSWPRGPALDPHLIAVAPFEVVGSTLDHWREDGATLLAARLDGAGLLRTVPRAAVNERWSEGGDRAAALRLAGNVGAGLVIVTRVVGTAGDSVRLSAALFDAGTGDGLEAPEVTGAREPIGDLVDSLATRVLAAYARGRMPPSIRWTSLGSSNPRAIKEFLTGELNYRGLKPDSARLHYERAIAEDSSFALAFRRLAYAIEMAEGLPGELWAVFPPWGDHDDLRLKAGSLNRGLAPRESLLLVVDSIWAAARRGRSSAHVRVGSEEDEGFLRVFGTLEEARRRFRQDPEVLFLVGHLVFEKGAGYGRPPEIVVDALKSVVTIDPEFLVGYFPLVNFELYYRGRDAGLETMRRYVALAPSAPYAEAYRIAAEVIASGGAETPGVSRGIDSLLAQQAMISQREAELWIAYESVLGSARLYPPPKLLNVASLSEEPAPEYPRLLHGRVREAKVIRDSLAPPRPTHYWWAMFYPYLARVGVIPQDTAVLRIRDYVDRWGQFFAPVGFRWWLEQGDSVALKRMIEILDSYQEPREHIQHTPTSRVLAEAAAHLVLLRGDSAEALELLTEWRACPNAAWCAPADFTTAELLVATNRLFRADALSGWAAGGSYDGALTMVQQALLRGRINEQDRPDVAAWSYQVVLDFWADGDPEVQPWVEEARAGLQRLGIDPE
jgi:serine/threonine-protein kinase